MSEKLKAVFLSNLDNILTNLEKDISEADCLEDKIYLEISKSEIINYLNTVYSEIKCWKNKYEREDYESIINKYKEVESIVSQLELCLADYEDIFHMDGISYSIYEIGKMLSIIK